MKIGIDALFLQFMNYQAGLYQYTYHLILGLQEIDSLNDYTLFFFNWHSKEQDQAIKSYTFHPNFKKQICRIPYRVLSSFSRFFPNSLVLGKVDILHGPTFRLLPQGCYKKSVVTIHDLKFLKHPELFSDSNGADFFRKPTLDAIQRADCLIAVSEFTKNELIENFRLSPDRIKVIYLGIGKEFNAVQDPTRLKEIRLKYRIKNKYLLFVGFLEAKKNIPRLIEAFSRIRSSLPEPYQLVITGPKGPATKEITQKIKSLSLEDDVILTGQIHRKELPLIYAGASLFTFPSLQEGFGIPPIEAMASGIPVVSSNAGSLQEVVGDGGLLVDPLNIGELAEAIRTVLTDNTLWKSLKRKGLSHSKKFSWNRMAQEILQLYQEL